MRRMLVPVACACALFVAAAVFTKAAHAQARPAFDEGIVELVAERLPPVTIVVLVDSAGRVLLPVTPVLEHLGYEVRHGSRRITVPQTSGARITVDADALVLASEADTVHLAGHELAAVDDVVYLIAGQLARVLEAQLDWNAATLTASLRRRVPFPEQQRLIAAERRAMVLARERFSGRDSLPPVPYAAATGAGIVDWEVASHGLDPRRLTTVRTQAGAALLGGDVTASVALEVGRDAGHGARDPSLRFHRVFPGNRLLSQLRAGDIISSGIFARFIEGVEIGNRPFIRESELGAIMLRPDLPAGWDYEVFQGNQLLGYSERGSHEPVPVPLRAGATPVQVRMYGPAGEEVVSTLLYQSPVSMLRRGALEYAAAVGRCEARTCSQFAHSDVRWGASSHLTLGGGFEFHRDTLGSTIRPYAVTSFTSGQRMTGELQVMPGAIYGTSLSLFAREGSVANMRGSVSSPGFGPLSLIPDQRSRWDVEVSWDERFAARAAHLHGVRVTGASSGSAMFGLERWRMAATGSLRSGYAELRYDNERAAADPHSISARAAVFTPLTAGRHTIRPMLSGAVGAGRVGVRLAEFGASVQPVNSTVISASVQWVRGSSTPALALAWNSRLGAVQSALRTVTGRSGGGSSAAMISGSSAVTPRGAVTTQPAARTGYAGVHGLVFIDHDGDGLFSDGDEPLPGAAVVVGGHSTTADRHGRYHVWGLRPYEVASVAVDSTRIDDPALMSLEPRLLRPVPNTARRADLPLVRTGEVAGSLAAAPGIATLAGVTVELVNMATGAVIRAKTFTDGQFYVSRVPPGDYRMAVAASSLAALSAHTEVPFLQFAVSAATAVLTELPPLRLEPIR